MKNSKFFPFERNKYFYGKLLSVDDFELEQKYGNDKRRMINRFINGTGIIAGMYVVGVDEQTISVEAGCAIDTYGREIVIDSPVIKKLSLLDGFAACTDMQDNYVYLCVEYDEKETNPVHNIAGNSRTLYGESQSDFSRIREGYRLYLSNQEPEDINLSCRALYETSMVVYDSQEISIRQTFPRFVKGGQEAELKIQIENLGSQYISFSYQLDLACLTWEGESQLTVSFDERMHEKTGSYELSYRLKAAEVSDVECGGRMEKDSLRLFISKQPVEVNGECRFTANVTGVSVKEAVIHDYYQMAMERVLGQTYKERIYLAKIYMTKTGDTYMIARIEPVPFYQYIMSNELHGALEMMALRETEGYFGTAGAGESGGQREAGADYGSVQVRSGVYEFEFHSITQKGQKLFSQEIFHGLGMGNVSIQIGVETSDEEVLFDPSHIFEDRKRNVETAVCSNEAKGSFIIGVRLLENGIGSRLRIHWTALRNAEDQKQEKVEKKIFIKPSILELGMRESYYLEAVCSNLADKRIQWSVKDNGGFIDDNGYYTAPNVAGVYEVMASSIAYPEVKASIFIVVRDKNQ